jgi:translation initiation factor 2B subunit (eIF-2B alpha/beta/delta family)/8-oxo-dGTP pyrophosphatase MutT (NUDIX family)
LNYRQVVTSFLLANGRILLLRRSAKVGTHRGKWSAVSGYLEGGEDPLQRAVTEIREETGLSGEQITLIREGEILRALDDETDTVWIVHPFLFKAGSTAVRLDWENTEYRWVEPKDLASHETVPKLEETFDCVSYDPQATPEPFKKVLRGIEEIDRDRVHGASFLGRRAVELLTVAGKASDAKDKDEWFSQLMLASSRLRRTQPAMANVWNLTGKLLHLVSRERAGAVSVEALKTLVAEFAHQILELTEKAAEDASRNTVRFLPKDGCVLTHSYSNTVLRALELGSNSGSGFQVYATESYPGMEGKQLAKDLIALGVPVKLIADSTVSSVISGVNLVLVGADSVLTDGSLIHKTGTRNIAAHAKGHGVPFCSVCETTKFSTRDFLGEKPEISQDVFDTTPAECISNFITEEGELESKDVGQRIRNLLKEIYP